MKHFAIVPPQEVTNVVTGEVIEVLKQEEALLTMTLTPSFCDGKQGPEAGEFAEEAQNAVRAEARACLAKGYWSLETEHHRAFERVAKTMAYQGVRAKAWRAHQLAILSATSEPPGAAARPLPTEANGSAAQA